MTALRVSCVLLLCATWLGCNRGEDNAAAPEEVSVAQESTATDAEHDADERLDTDGQTGAASTSHGDQSKEPENQPEETTGSAATATDTQPGVGTTSIPKTHVRPHGGTTRRPHSIPQIKPTIPVSPRISSPLTTKQPPRTMMQPHKAMSEPPRHEAATAAAESTQPDTAAATAASEATEQDDPPSSEATSDATAAADDEPFVRMQVYYGTDRAHADAVDFDLATELVQPLPIAVATIALVMGGALMFLKRAKLGAGLAATGIVAVAALVGLQFLDSYSPSNQVAVKYGNGRGTLELGQCEVTIPKTHRVGEMESPSVLRLEFQEDKQKHIVLNRVERLESDHFFAKVKADVAQSSGHELLVFVHGYNVTFENAARRTAQIAYDLKCDSVPVFFSWPSQGGLFKYTVDETNVSWSAPHLKKFLLQLVERTGAKSINLIAHSMGNRALTEAVRDIAAESESQQVLFNQIVLAAPDVDAEIFKRDLAPWIVTTARNVTLYASSNDQALVASRKVHGHPRAGDSGEDLVIVEGIETIDVTTVDTSLLGHSYYGDNDSIISDIYHLFHARLPAHQRSWLRPANRNGGQYWIFEVARSAHRSDSTSR